MVKIALSATALLIALCSPCEAFDWRFSETDISALKNTNDFLRVLGMPAEVTVIREPVSRGRLATSRWTYYFLAPPEIVRVDYDFAIDRLVRRGTLSRDRSRRYHMLVPDSGRHAAAISRYKRDHPR